MTDLAPSPRYFIPLDRKYRDQNQSCEIAQCDGLEASSPAYWIVYCLVVRDDIRVLHTSNDTMPQRHLKSPIWYSAGEFKLENSPKQHIECHDPRDANREDGR